MGGFEPPEEEGPLDLVGGGWEGVPSPTKPFRLSELMKLDNMPHPEESEDAVEEEEAEDETSPLPVCPPFRRSENSAKAFKNALLIDGAEEEEVEEAMPEPCPRGGAPPFGGLESATENTETKTHKIWHRVSTCLAMYGVQRSE